MKRAWKKDVMDIRINEGLDSLKLSTENGNVVIRIKAGTDQCAGECFFVEIPESFVIFKRLKTTNIFKLIIYPNQKEHKKALKTWKKLLGKNKELLEANKRVGRNWDILVEIGRRA